MTTEESKFIDNKMLELEHDATNPEEQKQKDDEEDQVMKEFDDNMLTIEGLFVENKLENMIIDESEINDFTCLSKNHVTQKQLIPFKYDPEFLIVAANDLFDSVIIVDGSVEDSEKDIYLNIEGVNVQYRRNSQSLELTWNSSPKLDLITDAIGLLAIQLCKSLTLYFYSQ